MAHGLGLLRLLRFAFVQNPEEQDQVSSGTYWRAPAQLERRMMSQMALTVEFTDCWVASRRPEAAFLLRAISLDLKQRSITV